MPTPTEMEDLFETLDRRLDRIEQILPALATKDDLKAYATKEDLKALEARFETRFATKNDLREAFGEASRHARVLHEDLVERITLLGKRRRKRR